MNLKENKTPPSLELPEGVNLHRQTYEKEPFPTGVVVIPLKLFPSDWGGNFREASRVSSGKLEILNGTDQEFILAQINISNLQPGETRFWHVHPDTTARSGQNEVWVINKGTLLVGLVDFRKGSETYGFRTKISLTPDKALFIPKGVLHGFYNPMPTQVTLLYLTDQKFDPGENTQEYRVLPKKLPYDWVLPEKV